jgi:2-keto-4-pentenoate hydratase
MMGPIELAARRLRHAYVLGPVPPLRDFLDPLDGEAAYRVQAVNTAYWEAAGRKRIGRKIGLTSALVQAQLGVAHPDYGVLFDDMAVPDGGGIDLFQLLQPRIEAEIALVLGRDVDDPGATAQSVAGAIDHAVAALEIVDSRIADWKIAFADTVADNGSSALFVLGGTRRSIASLDLSGCEMVLEVDGVAVSTGAGAACLGHPLNAAAWLARSHSGRGVPLREGDVILTGALGPMVPLDPGSQIRAFIAGLGEVGCSIGKLP